MDYQGNSKMPKEKKPEKIVTKIVTGEVVTRPKSLGTKFKGIFFGGELKDAMRYVVADIFLPALRNLVVDIAAKGAERVVYGDSYSRRRTPDYRPRVTYNNPINRSDPRDRSFLPNQPGYRRYVGADIILSDRAEAELVLERLSDLINQFDVASIADLYDLIGLPTVHTDNKWGWSYLRGVQIRQVRDGYLIDLPEATPI